MILVALLRTMRQLCFVLCLFDRPILSACVWSICMSFAKATLQGVAMCITLVTAALDTDSARYMSSFMVAPAPCPNDVSSLEHQGCPLQCHTSSSYWRLSGPSRLPPSIAAGRSPVLDRRPAVKSAAGTGGSVACSWVCPTSISLWAFCTNVGACILCHLGLLGLSTSLCHDSLQLHVGILAHLNVCSHVMAPRAADSWAVPVAFVLQCVSLHSAK